jgi:hypothetical protein
MSTSRPPARPRVLHGAVSPLSRACPKGSAVEARAPSQAQRVPFPALTGLPRCLPLCLSRDGASNSLLLRAMATPGAKTDPLAHNVSVPLGAASAAKTPLESAV